MTLTLFETESENANYNIAGSDVKYTLITDPEQVQDMIDTLSIATTLSFDLEFTDLNPWYSHQLLWQLSDGNNIYVGITDLVPLTDIGDLLCTKTLIGHNIVTEFTQTFCNTQGKVVLNRVIDTMQAYQVAKAGLLSAEWGGIGKSGLDDVVEQYHGFKMDKTTRKEFIAHPFAAYVKSLPENWRNDPQLFKEAQTTALKMFTIKQFIYAANDVRYGHYIWEKLREELITKDVYLTAIQEFKLIPVFGYMKLVGWKVDDVNWLKYLEQLNGTLDNLVHKCKPALIEGLNNLEKNIIGDLVTKGNVEAHRRGGKIAKVRTDRSRVVMTDKNGNDKYSEDLQLRLFTPEHTNISFGREGDKFKMSREQLQDAFTGLGVNLETMDKAAILEALDEKISTENKELLKSMQILTQVSKLTSTYGQNVLDKISPDKVLWFDINQIGASATGRASGSKPRQNWAFVS